MHVLKSPLAMAIACIVRHVSKVGVLFAPSKKPTFQKLSIMCLCVFSQLLVEIGLANSNYYGLFNDTSTYVVKIKVTKKVI